MTWTNSDQSTLKYLFKVDKIFPKDQPDDTTQQYRRVIFFETKMDTRHKFIYRMKIFIRMFTQNLSRVFLGLFDSIFREWEFFIFEICRTIFSIFQFVSRHEGTNIRTYVWPRISQNLTPKHCMDQTARRVKSPLCIPTYAYIQYVRRQQVRTLYIPTHTYISTYVDNR